MLLNIVDMDPVLTTEKDSTLIVKELLVTQGWQKKAHRHTDNSSVQSMNGFVLDKPLMMSSSSRM